MDTSIEIAHYTPEQLVEALISVNDEVYFDNALMIYQTLLAKKGWHHNDTNAARLGRENHWLLELLHEVGLGTFILSGTLDDIYMENHHLEEKVQRLNDYLNAK